MSATDKKRRKLAMAIGESFAAMRRRVVRSKAWLSLSAPAIKIYIELRLRWRHKDRNNGQLFISLRECEVLLGLSRGSAVRAFAELETKGFIVKTRQGEAGRLPSSATLANGGTGFARQATTWALTDEPYNGQPASHAYEKWPEADQPEESRQTPTPKPKKQFHVSAGGPVEAQRLTSDGSAGGPPISTIYGSDFASTDSPHPSTESAPQAGDPPPPARPAKRKASAKKGARIPIRAGRPVLWARALDWLRRRGREPASRAEIMAACSCGAGEAQRVLGQLVERGEAEKGRGPQGPVEPKRHPTSTACGPETAAQGRLADLPPALHQDRDRGGRAGGEWI